MALPRRPQTSPVLYPPSGTASHVLSPSSRSATKIVVLSAVALFCAACVSTDPLLKAVEARSGSAGLACGVVLPGDDSSQVDSCAVTAFQRGVPFWVRYGACASDGIFESFYLVSTGENLLRVIRYESAHTRATSRFGAVQLVVDRECAPEIFQVTPGHFRLGCRGNVAPQPFVTPRVTVMRQSASFRAARKSGPPAAPLATFPHSDHHLTPACSGLATLAADARR
jgi:hypothetical protein